MLTLNDGRDELWQWDTGRRLTVDADCSQVHFSNKVFGRSVDVDVVDGTAAIPDVLLQVDKELIAWAFVGTAENGYTKISKVFKVKKRNKPADYVFTPPEQTTLQKLVERLTAIEESQDPDAIKNAVDDYLANNPITVKETDPTVSDWAKEKEKPSYTADEVGALSKDELSDAVNDALAQAKESGKFDGPPGVPGKDYVLTPADKTEIAEMAAELVDVPDSGGNVDLTGYATEQWVKDQKYLTEVPEDYAKTKDIPTKAEDIGALPNTYTPPNQTAEQVGADPKGTASTAVSQHNTADDSHTDIRLELKAINDRLTAFFDSDNQTLDELSEIVAYITSNKTLIDSITTSKVSVTDIINNLTTNVTNKPLSAAQGVVLKGLIDSVSISLANYQPKGDYALRSEIPAVPSWAMNSSKPSYSKSEIGLGNVENVKQYSASNPPPYPVTSVNGNTGDVIVDGGEDNVPSYWQPHLEQKVSLIREAMLSVGVNKSAFFFYSDSHWSNDTTYTSKKAPTLLKYLYKNTPIRKTNFGGDIVSEEADNAETMAYLWEWRNLLCGLENHHSVPGNHDDGNATDNLFSEQYVYGYLLAAEETPDIVRGDSGMYYYIDNPAEKTRYLYLDTAYQGVTAGETAFVKEALLSTQEDWRIVAIAHAWYANVYGEGNTVTLNGFASDAKALLDMFDSYNARSEEYAECLGWVEFCIGGHYHLDHVEHTDGGIPVIVVEADCLHDRSGNMPKAGTTDEAAISAVIADYNTKTVKIIRIGRGDDFETTINVKTVFYTNQIPVSIDSAGAVFNGGKGWADKSRIGSGKLDSYIGGGSYYITGHIPVDSTIDTTFYLRNIGWKGSNTDGSLGLATYKEDFTRDGFWIALTTNGLFTGLYAVQYDADNNVTAFTVSADQFPDGTKYIAICAEYIGDDSIITVNEPIE